MSGIAGILQRDGAPVERSMLRSLTHTLAFRGPDAEETWSAGTVGFAHTLLRTTAESLGERQPTNVDGRFWITADARLDSRAELERELATAGRRCRPNAPDCELILHSYAAWGDKCVRHLRGDFAFAIWDADETRLFCARDHFGLKPFYYTELDGLFAFSNTLSCLRSLPGISEELDDLSIADFLLFGTNYDCGSTAFKKIRRLPPAHSLSVSAEKLQLDRYWTPPIDGRIRYHHEDEYVEHFQILLRAAVADRLRTTRAGILLSGGLDSSAIAATAREISTANGGNTELRAYTLTYESTSADPDAENAREVAAFLKIPARCLPMDGLQPFERWTEPHITWPEPVDDPFFAGLFDQTAAIARDCRVAISGEGIDNLMHFEMWPYARHLARKGAWSQLLRNGSRYLSLRDPVWPGIGRRMRRIFRGDSGAPRFPKWIAPELTKRLNLADRWKERIAVETSPAHPTMPAAHASLLLPQWPQLFELGDAGVTGHPMDMLYPFLDLRIVNYVLALPPFPWTFEKTLLREAMFCHLPEHIRLRRKRPFRNDPLIRMLKQADTHWIERAAWSDEAERYVNRAALPALQGESVDDRASVDVRALCLNFWLQSSRGLRYKVYAEVHNG